MVDYKSLGLVNTREMFKKAINGGYAIPAFNFNNMEQLQAIIKAAAEEKSPVILQVSKGARNYAIYKRMKAKGTAMENKVESHKKKPSAKYEQGLMDLEDFITCFQPTGLLDADTLDSTRKEARGFVLGMKFAEACHE